MTSSGEMLEKIIKDAGDELDAAEKEMTEARNKYSKMVEDGDGSFDELKAMEKHILDLEKAHDGASKEYDNAMSLTLEDLEAEKHYEGWKADR